MNVLGVPNPKATKALMKTPGSWKKTSPLVESSKREPDEVLSGLGVTSAGLSHKEAKRRLETYGFNRIGEEKKKTLPTRVVDVFRDPLLLLLIAMAAISFLTGDYKAVAVISMMVALSAILRISQEMKADHAAEKLTAMVRTHVTVMRGGRKEDVPLHLVVPGDIILLSAGDPVPADSRLVSSKDLFVNQSALTGESLPVEKHASKSTGDAENPLELENLCFMGTNVESGTGTAVVVIAGKGTYFGSVADSILHVETLTSFDKGLRGYTYLVIRMILLLAPVVFLINGLTKGNWFEAFIFSLSIVVGLAPEMLPMIVNVNLAKGATVMSEKKVIVKRLNSIQNFGAMDVLCADKTGTLTQGRVILEKHIDALGREENTEVLKYAYINSFYQTGLKNLIDDAVLRHEALNLQHGVEKNYIKVDEITFDFARKRMSVVVEEKGGPPTIICKGAVEEMMSVSTMGQADGSVFRLDASHRERISQLVGGLNNDGFRVIAVGYKRAEPGKKTFKVADESDLTLAGFIAFLDPPKSTAAHAIRELNGMGVNVKVLTGDNERVTQYICRHVGIPTGKIILGAEVESMGDGELKEAVEQASVFAKLSPKHKERIISSLKAKGHVVGFMGDGINDAPALRTADVGISVDTAADIAKESSSIILLDKNLHVLKDGVHEGRKVSGNILKYVKMASSSSFGNMFAVPIGSFFLPFLPMLPLQVLVNNLLYDFSQIAIPTDDVDKEWLEKPRKWSIDHLRRFIILIGPISSVFDITTYLVMLYVFNAWANPALFQTGWFVESMFTQTLIIHVIRTNRMPFRESNASLSLTLMSLIICAIAAILPYSPLADTLGFVHLPLLYWPVLALTVIAYLGLTQLIKGWFLRKYGEF